MLVSLEQVMSSCLGNVFSHLVAWEYTEFTDCSTSCQKSGHSEVRCLDCSSRALILYNIVPLGPPCTFWRCLSRVVWQSHIISQQLSLENIFPMYTSSIASSPCFPAMPIYDPNLPAPLLRESFSPMHTTSIAYLPYDSSPLPRESFQQCLSI